MKNPFQRMVIIFMPFVILAFVLVTMGCGGGGENTPDVDQSETLNWNQNNWNETNWQ